MFFPTWRQWLKRLARAVRGTLQARVPRHKARWPGARTFALDAERLEDRVTPSGSARPIDIRMPLSPGLRPDAGPLMFQGAFTPAGIQKAYGIDQLIAGGNDGTGQTIALIDAFDDPAFSSSGTPGFATSDLHYFDQQFGLPDPIFKKVAEDGTTNYPTTDPSPPPNDWEGEVALDVEWAHAAAPGARILLVECASDSNDDLNAGVEWAATPVSKGGGGATVVSMSFGTAGGDPTATTLDANFSPSAFPGVTFLAAAGDYGSVRNQGDYPADSPDVVAVGGTRLTVTGSGVYSGETVWHTGPGDATGGGTSRYENQPIYQKLAEPTLTRRSTPDVAFDADPSSGVAVYDSYNGGAGPGSTANIAGIGGTSVSTPCWAGLIAIADQIRASQPIPEASLTGATQTLPILYDIYSSSSYHQDFHDITSGGNGTFNASAGYDEVTGIGTPIANRLVPALANVNQLLYTAPSGNNNFLLQANGADLDLFDNGVLVASNPLAQTTSAMISGASNNSLTVDAASLPANLAVTFDGGPGSQTHTLTIKNGSFTAETYAYAGTAGGTITLDGLTINFAHVTATANTTTGSSIVFNLPSGAQATLQANSSPSNAIIGGSFVASAFGNSFGTVSVNAGGGASVVQLASMDPGFNPATEVFSGQVGDVFQLQAGTAVASTTAVTLTTATLDLRGFSPIIDALAGNGTITNSGAGASTLTVGAGNGSAAFSGVINDGTGTVGLTKIGGGTQTLTGADVYTGPTTVAGGTLEIDGSIASSITVLSSATLDGAGTTGTVSVQSGGFLYPSTAVFALATGSVNLGSGSTFNVALNSAGSSSQLNVTSGTVTLAGANLVLGGSLTPSLGQFFTIINNNGNLPVSGTFNGLLEGAVIPNFLGSSLPATISYVGGDGNDVVVYVGQGALTATAVSASSGATTYGQRVTFTAKVTTATDTPSGNVEFFDKTTGADLGPGNLVSSSPGAVTWAFTTSPTQLQATGGRADDIRAVFISTGNFLPSAGILAGGLAVAPLSVSVSGVTANNKVYDHTTVATLNIAGAAIAGLLSGDSVTLNAGAASAAFASADVGNGIPVAVSGLTLSGAQARDYMLTQPTATANITPARLTITGITANSKVYDGTPTATLNTGGAALAGLFSGDAVTLNLSGATGSFATKDVGNNITVTVSGLTIAGAQASDYTLTQPTITANITPAPLTVTGITADKVYDATTLATLNTAAAALVGVLKGDTVTLAASGASAMFADRNVGNNIPLTVSSLTIGGPQGADYALVQPALSANITPAALTVTGLTVSNKAYDTTTRATLNSSNATLVGVFGGDALSLITAGATGTFASKDVGTNIPVTISGLTIAGAQSMDYTLTQPAAAASITPFVLTVSGVTANDKVYDATTVATLNTSSAALTGVFSGDTVLLNTGSAIGTFSTKHAGNGITVSVSGLTISGPQAADYVLAQLATTANITPAPVTMTGITANDKVYDATTTATLNTANAVLGGTLPGDVVTLNGATGTFASQDVGTNIPITSLKLAGAQAGDYTLVLNQALLTANITPAPLTVTGIAADKVYDATTAATLNPANAVLMGLFGADSVTLVASGATGTFASKDVANNITVTLSGLALDGPQAGDYALAQPATTTANITPAPLTVTGITANKAYDATTHATPNASQAVLGGIFSGDTVTLITSALTGRFANKDVANNILVVLSGLALGGPQANDYVVKQPTTTKANITPAPLTVIGITANDKVYDGTTLATLNTSSAALAGVFSGDAVTLNTSAATGTFATKDVANNVTVTVSGLTLGGIKARDYLLTQPTTNANITPPASSAAYFAISAPGSTIAGVPISFTITARDRFNNPAGAAYTGTIHFSSTDALASLPGDTVLVNGTGTFSATLNSAGTQTISAGDTVSTGIIGSSNLIAVGVPATQFAVSAPATATAGAALPVTVTAQDGSGHTAIGYAGTMHLTSTDGQALLPADAALTNGTGTFLVTLRTATGNPWTVTATDTLHPAITGTSGNIMVSPGAASYFTLAVPAGAITTGSAVNVTVTAHDQFGNIATAYGGHIHFASSDASAVLPADSTLASGTGSFSVTLNTAGSQTITTSDTVATNPGIVGTSAAITTRGLTVTSFTPTPTGFTAMFSKPFLPGDITLYGIGQSTVQDVMLVGAHVGAIGGSLLLGPSNTSITFNATSNSLLLLNNNASAVLPDDTYTVTLVSGSTIDASAPNGFLDALGAGLDGLGNASAANYVSAPFTTHYQANQVPVLAIPDFARGPDDSQAVKVPNDSGNGIPITLYNAANVTDVMFTLSYNPSLLTVAGASNSDATDRASSFTLIASPTITDTTHATARFHFHDGTAQSGAIVLGDIVATVPASAAGAYKAKELLQVGGIMVNSRAVAGAVSASGVHINAYFGDVTGNGTIDGLDVATAYDVAQGKDMGFAAYPLLDPAIVGDVAADFAVDAGDVSTLAAFVSRLPAPGIPAPPPGLAITATGADPTLSLGEPSRAPDKETGRGGDKETAAGSLSPSLLVPLSGIVSVPVLLDDPHPADSTGMTEAILALAYDPSAWSVSSITLGSIPAQGSGWQLSSVVDQEMGRIGIILYSTTPITSTHAGSLVNVVFEVRPGTSVTATTVQMVSSAFISGREYRTQVDDALGQFQLGSGTDHQTIIVGERVFGSPAPRRRNRLHAG